MSAREAWSDDARWRAVLDRDPRAEGRFVYAVATTGIYCRPTCPSRRPKRGNVAFYATPAEAEGEGFRACERCAPKQVPLERRLVAAVQERIEAAEVAPTHLGMTPGRFRRGGAGEIIRYAHADGALGRLLVAATDRGVCALRFGRDEETQAELRSEFPAADLARDDTGLAPLVARVCEHLATLDDTLTLALDIEATAFQQKVWRALRAIPVGETRSYGQIAEAIGAPDAVRAVAQACARNPVALAIPCHRVIRASGDLAGYRWNVARKRAILDREKGR